MSKPVFASADCPNCGALFDRLPVDYDEDGNGYAALEVAPCADPECEVLLCPDCARFTCDGCGQTFCLLHRVLVENGQYDPLECCAACALECEQEELPAPQPPLSETGKSVEVDSRSTCPSCGSDAVRCMPFNFGVCPETGYHNSGERFMCSQCGHAGDAEEIDRLVQQAGVVWEEQHSFMHLIRKPEKREDDPPVGNRPRTVVK